MGELDPNGGLVGVDIDVNGVEMPPALRELIISLQDTVRGLEQRIIDLSAKSPAELEPFTTPDLRLRQGSGVRLTKRGRNSYEIGLDNQATGARVEQLLFLSEFDNHLECQTLGGLNVNVMKPFDLQRRIYEDLEASPYNFDGLYEYTYVAENRRLAVLKSDPSIEEYQVIVRDYINAAYILAINVGPMYSREPLFGGGGATNPNEIMDYEWMDLNVAARAWARDTDQDP